MTNDSLNRYVYDVEGRNSSPQTKTRLRGPLLCAVENIAAGTFTQYVYDAEGRRVAKGSIPALPAAGSACAAPTAANGFALTNVYLRGLHGDQDTELNGAGAWLHTNIFAAGGLTGGNRLGRRLESSFPKEVPNEGAELAEKGRLAGTLESGQE